MNNAIFVLWSVLSAGIVACCCFFSFVDHARKKTFLLSNGVLILIGIALTVICALCYVKYRKKIDSFFASLNSKWIYFLSLALFLLSAYIIRNIYFTTGWDSAIITNTAKWLASGKYDKINSNYFSIYPNNLFITWVYSKLAEFNMAFGDAKNYEYFVVAVQSALMSITGLLLFKIVNQISKPFTAYFTWFVFAVLIGVSPWMGIIYTDALGLIMPTAILYLYLKTKNGRCLIFKWFCLGVLIYFGYNLKPQIIIVGIAIIIVEILGLCKNITKQNITKGLKKCLAFVLAVCMSAAVYMNLLLPSIKIEIDDQAAFGVVHFIKMGLNSRTDGAYLRSDVDFSSSFETKEERNSQNFKVIKQRISDYGFVGLAKHTIKKTLVNFGDGTFAWSEGVTFYKDKHADINEFASPALKSIYHKGGKYYDFYITLLQLVWMSVLFLSVGITAFCFMSKRTNPMISVFTLSIIGLTLFSTIFESCARYFFIYSPFFIVVAVFGLSGFVKLFSNVFKRIKRRN
ncbi:MAG: hypothetical protein IKL93_00780 [Clostridia bacterium]|nr:hypothetical protein [Clostridia bacterium]